MATLTNLPLIGRFFGSAGKKKSSPERDWQGDYRNACFVLKCFDSATLGEIKASYLSEINFWSGDSTETSILTDKWETIQNLHNIWVAVRRRDAAWQTAVTEHMGRSLSEIAMLYRHHPESDELKLVLEVIVARQQCFDIAPGSVFAEPCPVANRGGESSPGTAPKACRTSRLTEWWSTCL